MTATTASRTAAAAAYGWYGIDPLLRRTGTGAPALARTVAEAETLVAGAAVGFAPAIVAAVSEIR